MLASGASMSCEGSICVGAASGAGGGVGCVLLVVPAEPAILEIARCTVSRSGTP